LLPIFLTFAAALMGVRGLVNHEDIECLALNIYHESRNESKLSWYAVSQTVFNRVESKHFPDSICKVIYQGVHKGNYPVLNRCQFSWYCDGRNDDPVDRHAIQEARELAAWMLTAKDYLPQLIHGSLFYHAQYVSPAWSKTKKRILQVDSHIFYK
tara:strand:+ start:307 stop:771 length:465 start_codon:yes stop_codon:yes gene_type:complete